MENKANELSKGVVDKPRFKGLRYGRVRPSLSESSRNYYFFFSAN